MSSGMLPVFEDLNLIIPSTVRASKAVQMMEDEEARAREFAHETELIVVTYVSLDDLSPGV